MIKRRLSTNESRLCDVTAACPEILEMKNGDFAVIGEESTNLIKTHLPHGTGCGKTERIVTIPRAVLFSAIQSLQGKV